MAALPPELRSRASRLVERFHLDPAGWYQADEPVPLLPELADAVWDGCHLRITYVRGHDAIDREIGPLGLVLKGGVWYVVAVADGQIRTYRAARIRTIDLLEGHVDRPSGFDLATHWAESSAAYERATPTVTVTVRVDPRRFERLYDAVGRRVVERAERLTDGDPDDWVRLRLELPWPDEVPGQLLRAGSSIEVLDPPEIRARIVASIGRLVDRYRVEVASRRA
jgi:predicted DNA-binding transcriptional regulator YafY